LIGGPDATVLRFFEYGETADIRVREKYALVGFRQSPP
jgi:hypothetical protein